MAMMAGFQAAIEGDGDPKALDLMAAKVIESFPLSASVSDQEAKDYVALLGKNMQSVRAKYEAMMRGLYGDKAYERLHKASVDAMFKHAEESGAQKSLAQYSEELRRQYNLSESNFRGGSVATTPAAAPAARNARVDDAPPDAMALESASKLVGEDSMLGASLKGVAALRKGDAKGALAAAVSLVPVPGVKEAFSIASKLLFKD